MSEQPQETTTGRAEQPDFPVAVSPVNATVADWRARLPVAAIVLAVATLAGLYLCVRLAAPFVPALVWAVTLAVLFAPMQRRLEAKFRRPGLAAGVAVLVIGLIVVVPAAFVLQQLLEQAQSGAELVSAKVKSGEWRRAIAAQPWLAPAAQRLEQELDLPGVLQSLAGWLSGTAGMLLKGSALQAIGLCLTFYLLFYALRDRQPALAALTALSPLSADDTARLLSRVSDTIYATIYGTLAMAVVQGLLGGLMFWWLGLPAPLLWGVVMALLAVVPVLGAFIVWIPAALLLAAEGSWIRAIILALWGLLVVGTIDNLLLPVLMGNRLQCHTLLAFIAIIGGLLLFGAPGLILGPVVLTLTTALLAHWRPPPAPSGHHV